VRPASIGARPRGVGSRVARASARGPPVRADRAGEPSDPRHVRPRPASRVHGRGVSADP